MSVTIRLARYGRRGVPYYRIIVADKTRPRDGRYLEQLGTMNPLMDPPAVTLKEDRVKYWVTQGANPSHSMRQIISKQIPNFLEEVDSRRLAKIQELRRKRKARTKAAAKTTAK